jgi:hypothetical protein
LILAKLFNVTIDAHIIFALETMIIETFKMDRSSSANVAILNVLRLLSLEKIIDST